MRVRAMYARVRAVTVHVRVMYTHVRARPRTSVQCPCSVRAVSAHVHTFSELINVYRVIYLHYVRFFWPFES